jgi:hypothetical protein
VIPWSTASLLQSHYALISYTHTICTSETGCRHLICGPTDHLMEFHQVEIDVIFNEA